MPRLTIDIVWTLLGINAGVPSSGPWLFPRFLEPIPDDYEVIMSFSVLDPCPVYISNWIARERPMFDSFMPLQCQTNIIDVEDELKFRIRIIPETETYQIGFKSEQELSQLILGYA